ncbi:MAG: family 20 glycosylhydrolase [Merdibacter sp.]
MGVNIVPHFDTPGHSGAFTKVHPDLMLDHVVTGNANRAGEQFNLALEKYDESLAFVEALWDEYLTDDMFDESMTVHIGTDEYYGDKNRFRVFSNDLINYVQGKGRTVRMWGSLSQMPGEAEVASEGVQLNVWSTGWANPTDMYNAGYELINTVDGMLYMVPARDIILII